MIQMKLCPRCLRAIQVRDGRFVDHMDGYTADARKCKKSGKKA